MMKKAGVIVLKCTALFLIDLLTLSLFFSVWNLTALPVFPFALLNIMAVLVILNLTVFFVPYIRRSFRAVSTVGLMTAAVLFYVFTLCFTWLTYSWITVKSYLMIALLAFAFYLAAVVAMYLIGRREASGFDLKGERRVTIQDMQRLLMDLEVAVHDVQRVLTVRQCESLCRAFSDLREKLYFSTPFGRSNKPVVLDMEKRIEDRLGHILKRMKQPPDTEREEWISDILSGLMDTTELIKNKEKLLIS